MENVVVEPLVSVIMPFHNRADIISETLDSVLNQTFRDFELICVDDGSTDQVPQILAAYAAKDPRIKIISKKHTTSGDTRNVGFQHSVGKYIFFLDSDDLFEPDYLAQMVQTIQKENADVVICKYDEFDHHTKQTISVQEFQHTTFKERLLNLPIHNNAFLFQIPFDVVWNKIFKRELIEKFHLRFRNIIKADDVFFDLYYITKCQKIILINHSFVHHRVQDTRSTMCSATSPLVFSQELDYLRTQIPDAEFQHLRAAYYRKYITNAFFHLQNTTPKIALQILRHTSQVLKKAYLHNAYKFNDDFFYTLFNLSYQMSPIFTKHQNQKFYRLIGDLLSINQDIAENVFFNFVQLSRYLVNNHLLKNPSLALKLTNNVLLRQNFINDHIFFTFLQFANSFGNNNLKYCYKLLQKNNFSNSNQIFNFLKLINKKFSFIKAMLYFLFCQNTTLNTITIKNISKSLQLTYQHHSRDEVLTFVSYLLAPVLTKKPAPINDEFYNNYLTLITNGLKKVNYKIGKKIFNLSRQVLNKTKLNNLSVDNQIYIYCTHKHLFKIYYLLYKNNVAKCLA